MGTIAPLLQRLQTVAEAKPLLDFRKCLWSFELLLFERGGLSRAKYQFCQSGQHFEGLLVSYICCICDSVLSLYEFIPVSTE